MPLPPGPNPPPASRLNLPLVLGVAGGYALVGWIALMLAGPPGYASPLYPPAGIALAAALSFGRAALPGVWLGAFAVNAGLGALRGLEGVALVLLPLLIGVGAMLQAALGAALIRRFIGQPVVLNAPRDILMAGVLGAGVACAVSPTVATVALLATGALHTTAVSASNWLTWWVGDTLGVLIGAPLALTLIGRPREDWRPRRRTLGVPLLLALGLLAAAMVELGRLERQRADTGFEHQADRLATEARDRLQTPLHALQALHGAALARGGTLDAAALRLAAGSWLAAPSHLQAAGYSVRVPLAALPGFEAQARDVDGDAAYRVFDRDDGSARRTDGEVVAIRHIEPAAGNRSALGVNVLSIPEARAAVLAARDSGGPAASAGFRLTQSDEDQTGIVLYRPLYRPGFDAAGGDLAARRAQFSGVVFVTLRIEQAWANLAAGSTSSLLWCVVDLDGQAPRARLAGAPGCEQDPAFIDKRLLHTERALELAGRQVVLRITAEPAHLSGEVRETAWLLSLAGLSAAAMLGALLLTVTGATRRTEMAVLAGTAELRREMTEREQIQAALADSEARLRSIVDHAPLGVAFLDPAGHVLQANRAITAMLGLAPGALAGQQVTSIVHEDDRGAMIGAHRDLLAGRLPFYRQELRLRRGDGSWLWGRVSANALRGSDQRVAHLVAVVEDISEHLQLQASERALQEAEAANRAKSEFVSRMSHELRTPLNAMIGFAQLLELDHNPALVAHQREWTQQMQRAGWHLLELINDTLDLARIESGAVRLKAQPVDLVPLAAACESLVAATAAQRRVGLQLRLAPDARFVAADPTRLKQVLTNLLSNAVKYNREGGSVVVTSRRPCEDRVELSVSDSGLGMTPEQMSALFTPYNRLGREQSGIEGTGIGLVISRRLAELMGGELGVSSVAGEGSVFTLSLPAAAGVAETAPDGLDDGLPPYQRRLVHYVEDNPTNVEVMRGVLAQRPQIELRTSALGLDGLAAMRAERPDLVLLDMHLPDISGIELLRHLKDDELLAGIPVVVVSADATSAQTQQALTLGAVKYVTKPLDVGRFLQTVDEVLEAMDTRWGV